MKMIAKGLLLLCISVSVFAAKHDIDPKCKRFCALRSNCSSVASQCPLHSRCHCDKR